MSFSVFGPCELAAATDDMCHRFCMLLAQPASGILHNLVDLVCHCTGVEGLLLSCHDQSLGVCVDVAFIEPLICGLCLHFLTHLCSRHHAEVSHTKLQLYLAFSRWL